jgi:hypothetical protein
LRRQGRTPTNSPACGVRVGFMWGRGPPAGIQLTPVCWCGPSCANPVGATGTTVDVTKSPGPNVTRVCRWCGASFTAPNGRGPIPDTAGRRTVNGPSKPAWAAGGHPPPSTLQDHPPTSRGGIGPPRPSRPPPRPRRPGATWGRRPAGTGVDRHTESGRTRHRDQDEGVLRSIPIVLRCSPMSRASAALRSW